VRVRACTRALQRRCSSLPPRSRFSASTNAGRHEVVNAVVQCAAALFMLTLRRSCRHVNRRNMQEYHVELRNHTTMPKQSVKRAAGGECGRRTARSKAGEVIRASPTTSTPPYKRAGENVGNINERMSQPYRHAGVCRSSQAVCWRHQAMVGRLLAMSVLR